MRKFKSGKQRKAVMAKLKSRYTNHSNPCSYCSKKDCKSCHYNKLKVSKPSSNWRVVEGFER